jgi:hypothetical protein
MFGTLLAGVDHLPHTYDRDKQAFSKGEPEYGAHFAESWSAWSICTAPPPSPP